MLFHSLAVAASCVVAVQATSLSDVCNQAYAQASLPSNSFYQGITLNNSSVIATPIYNTSVSGQNMYPGGTFDYCNVTFAYSHNGLNDKVLLTLWLPSPSTFQNRWLSTGGGGLAINSGSMSLPGGIIYGAAAGITDGGFGGFSNQFDSVFLLANGTVNWQSVYMFGYQAHHELSTLGKEFTRNFFKITASKKLYSYYQGCSEGGREGWSQVQRFADEWDGAAIGAPAFRFGFQQPNHLFANVIEQTLNYYPPPCELTKVLNETIKVCDPLDGKTDGVISRSDLCMLKMDLNSLIGMPYYCAATTGGGRGPLGFGGGAPTPAQNGSITAKAIEFVVKYLDGLHDSEGRRVYLNYQIGSTFDDAATSYNAISKTWGLDVGGIGGEWIARFLQLKEASNLPNLDGVTYDTLKAWMIQGSDMYADTLQTTNPDLTPFYKAGGKVIHFHGESDFSIPTASSVRYYESVRSIMYPHMTYNESTSALNDWYRLYLVPGAGHCSPSTTQPNGPFPQTQLSQLIDWVEKGIEPVTLNATVLQGAHEGEKQQICGWPLRPLWVANGTVMECVYDQKSIDTWIYDFDGIPTPVY